MKFSIRSKLFIGFAFLLVLSSIFQGTSFSIINQYVTTQISTLQEVEANNGATDILNFFTKLNDDSLGLALGYTQSLENFESLTQITLKKNNYIGKITVLSPLGRELVGFDATGKIPQNKLSYEVYTSPFKTAVAGTPTISQVYYLDENSEPFIDTFYPIFGERHTVIGVVKMRVNLDQLRSELAHIRLGQNGYIYVVDGNGLLISHPSQAYVLQRPILSSRKVVADALTNKTPTMEDEQYRNEKNVQVITKAIKISDYNWVAVFEQPTAEAFSFLTIIRSFFIVAFGISSLFLILIALYLSENLTRPIRKLQRSAEQVESGQVQKIIIIKSGDEIESLSNSFASLIDQLLQREHLLEKISTQLKDANEKLKALDKLKNEFVSVASHELRTPMTAIKSYLWMALEGKGGKLNEKQKFYVQRGYNSVDRLIRLVNDMLNISRIESGKITIDLKSIDIIKLAQEVVDEVLPRAKEVGVTIDMQKPDTLPHVLADQDKIKEVLFNLLGNSLKFTPKDGTITVRFAQKGDFVESSVIDTGSGISPEDKGKLFQKFGLLEGSYITNQTSTHMGTGLGLYICRAIIDLHHGEIKAESEGKGKGSTFSFTLRRFKESEYHTLKKEGKEDNSDGVDLIHTQI